MAVMADKLQLHLDSVRERELCEGQ
jgi:hypothetical protein